MHLYPRTVARGLTMTALAGAAAAAYSFGYEVRAYTLRRVEMPVLPPGSSPVRVLHVSDLHMTPQQGRKQQWLRSLASLEPDLVVNTGDNLAHRDSVPVVLDALGALLDVPGVFVLGSNDYFAPSARNPARYLLPDDGQRNIHTPRLPTGELRDGLRRGGWLDLSNQRGRLDVAGLRLAFAGVDDPHLEYDDLPAVAGPADPDADLRVAVAHAPYLRVLDSFAGDGYDAIFAGHTHGGQLRVPGKGAIVTNCDLDPARARGLHRHPARSWPGDPGSSWLHVSAGLGTSPYAPARFACRPEASLVTLTEA
jgi:predicted MPP superfamily phosphohydrolase